MCAAPFRVASALVVSMAGLLSLVQLPLLHGSLLSPAVCREGPASMQ